MRKPANIPDTKRKGVLMMAIFHHLLSKAYLAVKQWQWLHSLEGEPHDGVEDGAEHELVLHQWVADALLLQGQLHDGHRALHRHPGVLGVQHGGLHLITAHICLPSNTPQQSLNKHLPHCPALQSLHPQVLCTKIKKKTSYHLISLTFVWTEQYRNYYNYSLQK